MNYIIRADKVKSVKARLFIDINFPSLNVKEWILVTPKPPEHDTQSLRKYQALLNGAPTDIAVSNEFGPMRRDIFLERINADARTSRGINFGMEYEFDLYARKLVPGKYDKPLEDLDEFSRKAYLRPTNTVDWDSGEFQSWLKETPGMLKNSSDKDIVFAYNVYRYITDKGVYTTDKYLLANSKPSLACRTLMTDCGGFATLFTAVMRANGIPARTLDGWWAVSGAQTHCKAEFWAGGIGWVPVDITSGFKNPDRFFGRDYGDFITIHTDNDLVIDTIYWGQKEFWCDQGWLYWITSNGGSGAGQTFKGTWTVEKIKE